MATTNVGKIKQVFKGVYSGSTSYLPDDIVTYVSETYLCILASTANLPTNATYWAKIVNKGTDGANANPLAVASTVQGDIYYNAGGSIARLAPGTSGFLLRTNGAGANPSWNSLSGGQVATTSYVTRTTQSGFSFSGTAVTGMNVSITPTSASSKILILVSFCGETGFAQWEAAYTLIRTIGGSTVNLASSKGGSQGSYAYGLTGAYDSYTGDNASSTPGGTFFSHIDTPNTTSAVTYALGVSNNGGTLYINRCVDDNSETGGSRITAIEIALS
jgi:hypothetical protein